MKPKRFTRNIHNRQDYCEFEVKNCPYKDIYGLEKYSELEENVDCDLSIAIDKLGAHEDIEQELGVDLVTLVKALKNGIWIKYDSNFGEGKPKIVIQKDTATGICWRDGKWWIEENDFLLKDYGKTWALTKEELQK